MQVSFQTHLVTFFFPARQRIWLKGHESRDKKMAKLQDPCAHSSCEVPKQQKLYPFEVDFINSFPLISKEIPLASEDFI